MDVAVCFSVRIHPSERAMVVEMFCDRCGDADVARKDDDEPLQALMIAMFERMLKHFTTQADCCVVPAG